MVPAPSTTATRSSLEVKVMAAALPLLSVALSTCASVGCMVSSVRLSVSEVGAFTTVMEKVFVRPLWALTVMVVVPGPTPVTTPSALTEATAALPDL